METKPDRHEVNEVFAEWRQSKDPALLERLAELMTQHATAVAYLVLGQRNLEVAQDAVMKGLESLESFRGDSLFSTWFHAVATNTARDRLRKEIAARKQVELTDDLIAIEPQLSALELEELTRELDPTDQEFVRDKLEGLVETEMTEKYGLTPEGIRSRWFRIRKSILRRAG